MPSREQVVASLYEECPSHFLDRVVRVEYNARRDARAIVLKNERGVYTALLERITFFDEEEWRFIGKDPDAKGGMWTPVDDGTSSLYDTEERAYSELIITPAYQFYFS